MNKKGLIAALMLFMMMITINHVRDQALLADTILYPLYTLEKADLNVESKDITFSVSPNTVANLYIEFEDNPNTINFDGQPIDTTKTYFKEIGFDSLTSEYTFNLATSSGNVLSDSIKQIRFLGAVPIINVSGASITTTTPYFPTETGNTYLHIDFDSKDVDFVQNTISITIPAGVTLNETSEIMTSNTYTFDGTQLTFTDINTVQGLDIPVDVSGVSSAEFELVGTYVSSLALKQGTINATTLTYDGVNVSVADTTTNYADQTGVSTIAQEVSLVNASTDYKYQYLDTDVILITSDPYLPGTNLSSYYTLTDDQNLYFSNFNLDYTKDFSLNIPYMQTGSFDDFEIYITEQNTYNTTGNAYDIFSESAVSDFDYAISDSTVGTGSLYQANLSTLGFDSLGFSVSDNTISYNINDSTINDGTNGVFESGVKLDTPLDDNLYFYEFNWDATNKVLSFSINTIDYHNELDTFPESSSLIINNNRANNELVSVMTPLEIDMSAMEFNPSTFLLKTSKASNDRLYLPTVTGDRLYSRLSFYYSNINYDLPVDAAGMPSIAQILADSTPVIQNYLNGELILQEELDYVSVPTNVVYANKRPNSLETDYDPLSLASGYHHLMLSSKQNINGVDIYATNSLAFSVGDKQQYQLQLNVESPTLYPVGIYIPPEDYSGFDSQTDLLEYDGAAYNTILDVSDYTTLFDFSQLNYNVKGFYDVYHRSEYPSPINGEIMYKTQIQTINVDDPALDFGDLPKSYGDAASVGEASKTFQIGINLDEYSQSYIDREFYAYNSADARGDDIHGINDEYGYLNMSPEEPVGINYNVDTIRFDIPYIASSSSQICMWLDLDASLSFDASEGQCAGGVPIKHGAFGTVAFTYNIVDARSQLEPNQKVGMRLRISANSSMDETMHSTVLTDSVGEVEDFLVDIYGPTKPSEICIDDSVKTPTFIIKDDNAIPGGIELISDIPSSYAPGYVYQDAKIEITTNGRISFDAKRGESAILTLEGAPSGDTNINFSVRDNLGQEIKSPITLSVWGLQNGEFVKNTNPTFMGAYDDRFIQVGSDSVGNYTLDPTNDVVIGGQFQYTVATESSANPSSTVWLIPDVYFAPDFSFTTNAATSYFTLGLNASALTHPIEDCVSNFNSEAYVQVLGNKIENASLYNNYPFKYISENIAIPFYQNFESFSHVFEIPDGASFVDGESAVTVYRRPFYTNTSAGGDWVLVDPADYVQTIHSPTQAQIDSGIAGVSEVTFADPNNSGAFGHEYRFVYEMQIDDEYTYKVNPNGSKTVQTGQAIDFNTYLYYDKEDGFKLDTSGQNNHLYTFDYAADEAYYLNPVTVTIREPFDMTVNSFMSDETLYINTNGFQNNFTLTYNNCPTCTGYPEKTTLNNGLNEISVPIPDPGGVVFNSTDPFDMYEDMTLTIFDNDLEVLRIPIKRWYPSKISNTIVDLADFESYNSNLNPVEQQVFITMGYKSYQQTYFAGEQLVIEDINTIQSVDDGKLVVDPGVDLVVDVKTAPPTWTFITDDQLRPITDIDNYKALTKEHAAIYLPVEVLDKTLNVPKQTFDGLVGDYGQINFGFSEDISTTGDYLNYIPSLKSQYVIEEFSGRIYNTEDINECTDQNLCSVGVNYSQIKDAPSDIATGYNDIADVDLVISDILSNEVMLNGDETLLGKTYDYVLTMNKLGLNESDITVSLQFSFNRDMLSYKKQFGKYYFHRSKVEDFEKACIEADTCSEDYQFLFDGKIYSTADIRNKISNEEYTLYNAYTNYKWIESYYE